jgi:hypothetical protein
MKINLPNKYREPFASVMRLGAVTPTGTPEIKKLLKSVEDKLQKGDEPIVISKDQYKSFFGPVAQSLQAFPEDSKEEIRKNAYHVCRVLMDAKTLESYRDKDEQKLAAPWKEDAEYVISFNQL